MTAETQEQTPSQQIRAALVAKGYRLQTRRYGHKEGNISHQLDTYVKGIQICLLEIVTDDDSREVSCDLYLPASNSLWIADTIAAIP